MNKIESYEKALVNISPKKWPSFLMQNAFVSGNKINAELANTFTEVGTLMDFKRFIRIDHIEAPEGSAEAFLTYCGVLGYGVYLSKYYDRGLLTELRERANDPRLSVRQAVVKALRYIGHKKFQQLLNYIDDWKIGTPLEQRACLAAVCSDRFLRDQKKVNDVLELLEWITATFVDPIEWNNDYEVLQKEVSRCWAFVVAANPEKGKRMMERWIREERPVVTIIMKKSLLKESIQQLDHEWANSWLSYIRQRDNG